MTSHGYTAEEQAMIIHYELLVAAELRRIGVSEENQLWIHAGSDKRPTAALYQAWIDDLRKLPTSYGVEAYCAWLGFDYHSRKRELLGHMSDVD